MLKKTNVAQKTNFYKLAIWQKLFFCNSANVRRGRVSFLLHHATSSYQVGKLSIEFNAFEERNLPFGAVGCIEETQFSLLQLAYNLRIDSGKKVTPGKHES